MHVGCRVWGHVRGLDRRCDESFLAFVIESYAGCVCMICVLAAGRRSNFLCLIRWNIRVFVRDPRFSLKRFVLFAYY